MKNILLLTFFMLLLPTLVSSQAVRTDTIINNGLYKSYFCYFLRQPLYATYTLYKGGGDCDRDAENFSFSPCDQPTATDEDYSHSGYDQGHLVNAEDFAYDCSLEKLTFCFYNCLPQTPALNRGIWKSWETKIRKLSQTVKLFVIAGGIYSNVTIGPDSTAAVPDYCYKIVLNSNTKKILYCMLFPNDNSHTMQVLTLSQLKKRLGYPLVP